MCDTVVTVEGGRVLFAKNSDRDPNEAQLLQWIPAAQHPAGARLRCTWIEVPQVKQTHAALISRPFWIWGAEMGANEHGVVIGNEAVFTRQQPLMRDGLTGMDLVRLALERSATRADAVEVIVALLQRYGQSGCSHEHPTFSYHNSFLIADPGGATVLETAGRHWATEEVRGTRGISNGLTIPGFAQRHAALLYTAVAESRRRRATTERLADPAGGPAGMMRVLRSHGQGAAGPRYRWINGAMSAPCMHGGGLATGSQTTASWVSALGPDGAQHWVTATAAPCTALFKPVRIDQPLDLGPAPADRYDDASLWWRHELLHRRVMRRPETLLPLFVDERDRVEACWLAAPPEPPDAFAEADELLTRWSERVAGRRVEDCRPWPARRYWRRRARRAGLPG